MDRDIGPLTSVWSLPAVGGGVRSDDEWDARRIRVAAQLTHGDLAAEERLRGASSLLPAAARTTSTPRCQRRCMSSPTWDGARRAMWSVDLGAWKPSNATWLAAASETAVAERALVRPAWLTITRVLSALERS